MWARPCRLPRLTAQAGEEEDGGVVNSQGWDGLLDAHRHIIFLPGDLFHSEEIHSSKCAFFITVQGHNSHFRMHTLTQLGWTDVTVLSDPSLSDVTVRRCKWLISAA